MTQIPHDLEALDAARILVIAPHPDDEALGCGGLLALLAARDRTIHVVFVTDGGASHLGSTAWPRARLALQRESEAAAAMEALGLGDHARSFLRLADAAMPPPDSVEGLRALDALTKVVRVLMPDLVLLPWRRDPHRDHRDAWALTHAALAAFDRRPRSLEYAIWLDELGAPEDRPVGGEAERVAIEISAVQDLKRAAVMAHVSQTTALISDDPGAFRLSLETIDRLTGPLEFYWRPLA
ncbi:MAG: PIG-L family deacetylase [Rhizobiaceae bacterium]|nr:PIG-L family deacetylase [Rhizobiaceae bacterium]